MTRRELLEFLLAAPMAAMALPSDPGEIHYLVPKGSPLEDLVMKMGPPGRSVRVVDAYTTYVLDREGKVVRKIIDGDLMRVRRVPLATLEDWE